MHLAALAVLLLPVVSATAVTLSVDGKPSVTIVLADNPAPAERTAAQELVDYLGKATGGKFAVLGESAAPRHGPRICVGPTALARSLGLDPGAWGPEQWAMRTAGDSLTLVGGRPRGTLYAVYHFLEDVVGVRWWNPFEEYVPARPTLQIAPLDRQGEPRFRYRDIHLLYGNDGGRFAARSRINGHGWWPIDAAYGSGFYYGPPFSAHTFCLYVPSGEYLDRHPEWFSLVKGKRTADRSQLCLTNPELRAEVARKLRGYIEQARAAAADAGRPAPVDFDISQNDWGGMCECARCREIAGAEGSESGLLLDFLNRVADSTGDAYPQVRINTLAYQMTEDPPRTIRPRGNVVPRLCDTNANLLRPITHPDNRAFAERLAAWGRISGNLRIWDYAVTYTRGAAAPHYGLPLPTAHTYPIDYRCFAEHNVEGVFTEHEYPILADWRDFKVWMMMKLLEDPWRDYEALVRDFTDGCYGPAGPMLRRYLADLQAAAEAPDNWIQWFPDRSSYGYLTLDVLRKAQATFDEAEQAVAGDPVLLRRVRHARLPADRACLALWPVLVIQWVAGDGAREKMPLDRDAIARRCRETWYAQIDLRFPESERPAPRAEADAELTPLLARPACVPLPEPFRGSPPGNVFDFTAEHADNRHGQLKLVPDEEAECGIANRLELTDEDLPQYRLPMRWGVSAPPALINAGDVPGPGYHWYKLAALPLSPSSYVYFFWSEIIQFPVKAAFDPRRPDRTFEVWARIKFEGPGFPHARPNQTNAICVERVVLVQAPGLLQ